MQDNDLTTAFGDLTDRSRATEARDVADRLILKDYVVAAEIGAFQLERGITQRLRFSILAELNAPATGHEDDVDRILSYDRLIAAVDRELAVERLDLLETLAERIAARVLAEPQADRVFVRIEKLDRGPWVLGVEIARTRDEATAIAAGPRPRPVIAYFQGAIADLPRRMERLTTLGLPVVIVLGMPDMPKAKAATAEAQFRIDLLVIEQAAWSLASRDARLSVVSSRTEIDWAIGQGRIIVWAPSKLICDTPGAPRDLDDGMALTRWLAGELDAQKIVVHGTVASPAESRIPVEAL